MIRTLYKFRAFFLQVLKNEYVPWFKISYLFFKSDEDVFCGIVYIPPENSKYLSIDCF